ncbi:MAG: hypothetical protein CMA45_01115 [Euryarchaeota archaeon]|nr:hypothetical protein [Euryarchaeota archaeon]
MGNCPYCRSVTLPGDTICYSCGRVLANIKSPNFAAEQQFNRGSVESTYLKTKRPTKSGMVMTQSGKRRNILKRRKNRFRSVVMLGLVAFIMLSPQAREVVWEKYAGVVEYVQLATAPYHLYPIETTYTLGKTIDFYNAAGNSYAAENLAIPTDVSSLHEANSTFEYTDGVTPTAIPESIQKINSIKLIINNAEQIDIPLNGLPSKSFADRVTTSNGHDIWWPGVGPGINDCKIGNCVKFNLSLGPGESAKVTFAVNLTSTSYSWWSSTRVDSRIAGHDDGIDIERSGTFDDISERGGGSKSIQFGAMQWYNRGSMIGEDGPYQDYAIDAIQFDVVQETADTISASIPEGRSDNAYAFARATFDYLHKNVAYDKNAPVVARSGPACLAASIGDCDEQTNAYFSILRTKGIPGWYVFGALTDSTFQTWEGHAWGYILLPMSDSWCMSQNIELDSCFVEGSVDVVNNKWLLHTPTAYIDWIEEADPSGNLVKAYYKPGVRCCDVERVRSFSTLEFQEGTGGTFQVKKVAENLR